MSSSSSSILYDILNQIGKLEISHDFSSQMIDDAVLVTLFFNNVKIGL